jgi:hypothetical protein
MTYICGVEKVKINLDGWIVSGGVALMHAGHKMGLGSRTNFFL